MRQQTLEATYGALLHDLGKIVHRAGKFERRSHCTSGREYLSEFTSSTNILNCIQYHHRDELRQSELAKDSPAYLVYLANRIASATDHCAEEHSPEGEKPQRADRPLASIFNLLHGRSGTETLPAKQLDGNMPIPIDSEKNEFPSDWYTKILNELSKDLSDIPFKKSNLDSLLQLLETHTSFIPSNITSAEEADISLYDHSKITAAIAACYSEYFLAKQIDDFKKTAYICEAELMQEKTFLLFSADLSGIQKFIYNVVTDNALKSLRSRSFFLEIFMEHLMDELLDGCYLSRANLIFQGGGHCYVLLPYTEEVISFLNKFEEIIKKWMVQNFRTGLTITMAWIPCSGNDIINEPAREEPYKKLFSEVEKTLTFKKLNRYTLEQIRILNKPISRDERECMICGATEHLTIDDFCSWCNSLQMISNSILKEDLVIVTMTKTIPQKEVLTLPSATEKEIYLYFLEDNEVNTILQGDSGILRVYSKNRPLANFLHSTRVFVGDYCSTPLLDQMAQSHEGIQRIAVFRGDVDNLGYTMLTGYEQHSQELEERYRFVNLSRVAGLSRQLSLFFKYYVNQILAQPSKNRLSTAPSLKRDVMIVYSGGDDIFLIGQWQDTIESALEIREAFRVFTGGALTLSGGLGLFDVKHPVAVSALEVAEMEETSKKQTDKNALTLFHKGTEHTYEWEFFQSKVLLEKVTLLQTFFANDTDSNRGNAFLYGLLDLLRESNETINIARCAYKLARLAPKDQAHPEVIEQYKLFSKKIMKWIRSPEERRQFITAATIYIYMQRRRVSP